MIVAAFRQVERSSDGISKTLGQDIPPNTSHKFEAMAPQMSKGTKKLIEDAVLAGRSSESAKKSESRYIVTAGNKRQTLLLADGRATVAGKYYYRELLKLPIPTLYAYEAPLIANKWVTGFSGRKSSSNEEIPTVIGSLHVRG